jgi:hypothetical protein
MHVCTGPLVVTARVVEEIQSKVAKLEVLDQLKQQRIENLSLPVQLQKASQTTRTKAFVGKVMTFLK